MPLHRSQKLQEIESLPISIFSDPVRRGEGKQRAWLQLWNTSFAVAAQQWDTIIHVIIHMIHNMFPTGAPRLWYFLLTIQLAPASVKPCPVGAQPRHGAVGSLAGQRERVTSEKLSTACCDTNSGNHHALPEVPGWGHVLTTPPAQHQVHDMEHCYEAAFTL